MHQGCCKTAHLRRVTCPSLSSVIIDAEIKFLNAPATNRGIGTGWPIELGSDIHQRIVANDRCGLGRDLRAPTKHWICMTGFGGETDISGYLSGSLFSNPPESAKAENQAQPDLCVTTWKGTTRNFMLTKSISGSGSSR